jgi:hypothetical protein
MGNTGTIFVVMVVMTFAVSAAAFDCHPSDFAVSARYGDPHDPNDYSDPNRPFCGIKDPQSPYDPIYGWFDKPGAAIGRPTQNTTYDRFGGEPNEPNEPVHPAYPAWRANELVSIGNGTATRPFCLIVEFDHPVADDRNNPYGMDFVVFGNALLTNDAPGGYWPKGGDPTTVRITAGLYGVPGISEEPGIVSVSQDGIKWYTYASPIYPRADSFAPTAAYRWDYTVNRWDVNSPLDPTRPIDPNLKAADLLGLTVAEAIDRYDGSAGGAAYDISVFGLPWIKYVKISDDPTKFATTEIDAVADVSTCGDYRHPFPAGDLNYDCRVDFKDLAALGTQWLGNAADLRPIAETWLACTWECN